jgi:hypothetical protein
MIRKTRELGSVGVPEGIWRYELATHPLSTDFPAIWSDPGTLQRDRKRMLGLLIEDITLIKQHEVAVAVRFPGGATKTLSLPRP